MSIDKEEKLVQLLLGELSADEEKQLRQQIAEDQELRREWNLYQALYQGYREMPMKKPGQDLTDRFDEWLSGEISQQRQNNSPVLRSVWKYGIAASILILIGWFVFKPEPAIITQRAAKHQMVQLIADQSPTQRIKGLESASAQEADPEIIAVLLKVLKEDESPNVRLRAVEAIQQFDMTEEIKDALIAALDSEAQPAVQIAMINALVGLREEKAKPTLESLIEKEDVQPFVKDEARLGLTRL